MHDVQDKLMKSALLVCSLTVLFLLVTAAYKENFGADWYRHQSEYKRELLARASAESERQAAKRFDVGQKQLYLPDLDRIDRCVTCHIAIDNPAMADAGQPLTAHPGGIMENHPKEQFGCTICHDGQGRATIAEDAHGHVSHWLKPMLASEEMDQSCPKCHTEQSLPNVARYNAAMDLFFEYSCLTCHKLRSRGGDIGPDITNAGEVHDAEWHFKHFKDPKSVVETSEMTNNDFSDEQAQLLTFLMMCYKEESIPTKLLSNPKQSTQVKLPEPLDILALEGFVGSKFCISCHGATHPDTVEAWRDSNMASAYEHIRHEPVKDNCLPCHTTGLNSDTGHFSEEGVGCEACHGPGREAVRAVLAGDTQEHKQLIQIDQDSKPVCERCHNPHIPTSTHAEFYRKLPTPVSLPAIIKPVIKEEQVDTIEPVIDDEYIDAIKSAIKEGRIVTLEPAIKEEHDDTIKSATENEYIDTNKRVIKEGRIVTLEPAAKEEHDDTIEPVIDDEYIDTNKRVIKEGRIVTIEPAVKEEQVDTIKPEPSPAPEHQGHEVNPVQEDKSPVSMEPEQIQSPPPPRPIITKTGLELNTPGAMEKEPGLIIFSQSLGTEEPLVSLGPQTKLSRELPDVILPKALAMPAFDVIFGSSADSPPTKIEGGCVSSDCHSSTVFGEFVHGPTAQQDCEPCHRLVDETRHKFELTYEEPNLCFECHDPPEKAEFQHGPVNLGVCTVCHNPHSGPNEFMLTETGNNLCFTCHTNMHEYVESVTIQHDAITEEGCTACHDPHRSNFENQLKADMPELCMISCHEPVHEPIQEIIENATVKHDALTTESKCANCHQPHGTDVPGMLKEEEINLCLDCHDEPMETENGPIIDMKSLIENNPERHGPIRDGNCTLCHQPHGSQHFRILSHDFPRKFYMPFSIEGYDLCFQCHESTLVLDELTTVLTDFRNGDKNLHYVHVNQKKGRTCRACHEVHAGTKPKRITDFVPFGSWMLPVNFELADEGGACAPGCHISRSYNRKEAVEQQ